MTHATEFPDFDLATLPAIPSGWRDVSWANDTCPSWLVGPYHVFVNYADPADREDPNCSRFFVLEDGDGVLETDDWAEILAFVEA